MDEKQQSILVVDDSADTLEILRRNLLSLNYLVYTASGVAEAINMLETYPVDLVITDLKMPSISGIDLVRHVHENLPETAVMVITGYATIESAVKAVKTGAEEYLAKPFTDKELEEAVGRVLEKLKELRVVNHVEPEKNVEGAFGIIGESPQIARLIRAIDKISKSSTNVLITGESGVGKELVARAIHYSGPRASSPFVTVNCGAIPDQLVESELFGHVKGAFTGATASREGFFKAAHTGTILLDEISELSPQTQVKLLRVLQDKQVLRLGCDKPDQVDVRVLAASNKDLRTLVSRGLFREDLFFRVSVINIEVPPLRERGNDVLLLINHLTNQLANAARKPSPSFTNDALDAFKNYHWPGNIRELENILSYLVVMKDEESIDVSDLPSYMRFSLSGDRRGNRTLAEIEREHIQMVLSSADGNKTRAAKILGIDRKTLREKLKGIYD